MTDNDIKKALELCATLDSGNCKKCPCREICKENDGTLTKSILDLINRQKETIERLEKESNDKERAYTDEYCLRKEWQRRCRELLEEKQNAESEAIKEFAERLKEKLQWDVEFDNKLVFESDIENLVKEMTEV